MLLRLRRARTLARAGAVTALASLAFYVGLLVSQGGFPAGALVFIALILAGVYAAFRSVDDPHRARRLLFGATAAFGIVGIVGLLTIGILFLMAAVFTGIGAAVMPKHIEGD